ncbi:hypothetical protein LP420_11460 [Massilia sp. B-10]|nr:hypothetical protein LP420_11460 [Massilia sp. B-10]
MPERVDRRRCAAAGTRNRAELALHIDDDIAPRDNAHAIHDHRGMGRVVAVARIGLHPAACPHEVAARPVAQALAGATVALFIIDDLLIDQPGNDRSGKLLRVLRRGHAMAQNRLIKIAQPSSTR